MLGFFELRSLGIPSIKWKKYEKHTEFDYNHLWTVRTAVQKGSDMNLPRAVGVTSQEAKLFAERARKLLNTNDLIIYYPYFIAEKSGTLLVKPNGTYVIESVYDDLWNLVTDGKCEQTIIVDGDNIKRVGIKNVLNEREIKEILIYGRKIRGNFRDSLNEGKSILLEWSYAIGTDDSGKAQGESYLLFYECRTIN